MDLSDLNFNADAEPEWKGGFDVLADGDYIAIVDATDEKPVKGKPGATYLEVRFQVIEGERKGAIVFSRLNLKNPSKEAVTIARAELAAICKAVGLSAPKVTEELHGRPLCIRVKAEPREDKPGSFRNEIRGYFPKSKYNGAPGRPQAAPSAGSQTWQGKEVPF